MNINLSNIKDAILAYKLYDIQTPIGVFKHKGASGQMGYRIITHRKNIIEDTDDCVTNIYKCINKYSNIDLSSNLTNKNFTYKDVMPILCRSTDFCMDKSKKAEQICKSCTSLFPRKVRDSLNNTKTSINSLMEFQRFIEDFAKMSPPSTNNKIILKHYLVSIFNMEPSITHTSALELITLKVKWFHPDKSKQKERTEIWSRLLANFGGIKECLKKCDWDHTDVTYEGIAVSDDQQHIASRQFGSSFLSETNYPSSWPKMGPNKTKYYENGPFGPGYYSAGRYKNGDPYVFFGHPGPNNSIFYPSGAKGAGFYSEYDYYPAHSFGIKLYDTGDYGPGYYSKKLSFYYGCASLPDNPNDDSSDCSHKKNNPSEEKKDSAT